MTISLEYNWTPRGIEYNFAGAIVGTVLYNNGNYSIELNDAFIESLGAEFSLRWPTFQSLKAAEYILLAVAEEVLGYQVRDKMMQP